MKQFITSVFPVASPSATATTDALRALRDEAVSSHGELVPLSLLWQDWVAGACRVTDAFFTPTRCYVVSTTTTTHGRAPLRGRRLELLERILSGHSQKEVGLDMGIWSSSVANGAGATLGRMGLGSRASRVHPLPMLAAKAARTRDASVLGALSILAGSVRAVSIPRPDVELSGTLTNAEFAVVCGLFEGRSYQDIARERGTSASTVANQIAAAFQRLGVSGRNALVHRLFDLQAEGGRGGHGPGARGCAAGAGIASGCRSSPC